MKKSPAISLDSNIFILALDNPTALGDRARQLVERTKQSSSPVFISTMVLEEFFVRVYKEKRDKEIPAYLEFITLGGICKIVGLDQEIALMAAKLRAQYRSLRAPDAIHLASAIESKAKIFYTTDKRLPKKVDKLEVLSLA